MPDTLKARNNLASHTGRAEDAAGARDQFAALLPIREPKKGSKLTSTLLLGPLAAMNVNLRPKEGQQTHSQEAIVEPRLPGGAGRR